MSHRTSAIPDIDFYSRIRPATNRDCDAVVALIDTVLGEWDDAVCLDDSEKDLLDLQANYWDAGGAFVVMEHDNGIIGSHSILPVDRSEGICTFKRLYLKKEFRGTQAGHDLMQWNIDWSASQGFQRIEFWSDTRFKRAHHFFEKFGFEQSGEKREMNDSHETYWEYYFSKQIEPVGPSTAF